DRDNLRLCVSACLHSESPQASCRENSTSASPLLSGNYPSHQIYRANLDDGHEINGDITEADECGIP
ncbi:MAG: hypothetical protein Q4P24_09385, partial [Rhodobacterales bacterium]|nr:hypothetical protein [Rhodobacterales bacterium]